MHPSSNDRPSPISYCPLNKIVRNYFYFYDSMTIHEHESRTKISQTSCWGSFPPDAVGECGSGGPLQGPKGPRLQSLLCFPGQFIATISQCTLSAEQIHLPLWNHLEGTHCLPQWETDGAVRWASGLADRVWPVGYSIPPMVLKITSTSSDCPDRLGLWGSIISLQCLFNNQKGHTRALFTCKGIPETLKSFHYFVRKLIKCGKSDMYYGCT